MAHPFWILYWNLQKGACLVTEETVEMDPRYCYLIPPYTRFSTGNSWGFDHFYCHFKVSGYFERVQRKIYSFPAEFLRKKFPFLQTGSDREKQLFLLQEVLTHYLLLIEEDCFLPPGRSRLDPGIASAVKLMEENLADPPENNELARKAGMSLKKFYNVFFENVGLTPKRYLYNQRMEQARLLLLHSALTLEEIAERTGYADRFHFAKAFKQFFKSPPVSFRKKYRKEFL